MAGWPFPLRASQMPAYIFRNRRSTFAFVRSPALNKSGCRYLSTSAFDSEVDQPPFVPRRIYILGTGNIGKLVAHSLRSIPNPPPVTLLFHKPSLLREWRLCGEEIKLTVPSGGGTRVTEARNGFDVELAMPNRREHGKEVEHGEDSQRTFVPKTQLQEESRPQYGEEYNHAESSTDMTSKWYDAPLEEEDLSTARGFGAATKQPIHNLIVTTKASSTVSALSAIKHRLLPSSTVLFLQNGMGTSNEVSRELFPDEVDRPNYMQGIISHGVSSRAPFAALHAGTGTVQLGLLPRAVSVPGPMAPTARYLLRTLTRTPALCAVGLSTTDLLCAQLEKLAVNCIINPLTALIDSKNGALLYNYHLTRAQRLLLSEISLVIRTLPELRGIPNINMRFSPERLETLTVSVAAKTAENVSSMLADVRCGLQSEIDYINGYIVRRGEELGIRCVMNYLVMCLVKGKQLMVDKEMEEDVTLLGTDETASLERGEGWRKK